MRISAGALLLPLIAGVILVHTGLMTIVLPRWLMAMAYAFIGWRIGLRFTRPLLLNVAKAFPRVLICTATLIAICAGLGALLVVIAGVDPLTAYLATSPGGADSMAIIAASSNVDTSFVMTMQMLRFMAVLILGPALANFVAERARSTHRPVDG
jgi:membrane AbrB-like protein